MPSAAAVLDALTHGRLHPGMCSMCGPTAYYVKGPWLRDDFLCCRCLSIPRQRAIVAVLKQTLPGYSSPRVFESSPGGPSSDWLARRCTAYTPSQFFAEVPRGELLDGVRSEDLQALTLADESVDVLVTQDVFEHILQPDAALREIARVLAPGGVHVWTVPIFAGRPTLVRAVPDGQGGVRNLEAPDFHGNPLGGGSLVIHEWGDDLVPRVERVSGLVTDRVTPRASRWRGLGGELLDVLVSRKP